MAPTPPQGLQDHPQDTPTKGLLWRQVHLDAEEVVEQRNDKVVVQRLDAVFRLEVARLAGGGGVVNT